MGWVCSIRLSATRSQRIEAGRLVLLLEDWRTILAAIFLYCPNRQQAPVPLQAFIEFLRENLQTR